MKFNEATRPQYHFTPPANWMNDPNGMVYYKGEYHLFYQYYPGGFVTGSGRFADPMKWGPMHWGHAITEDLVHWDPSLPVALYPDSHPEDESLHGMIYSGSAVIDWNNTSGFRSGDDDLFVACFTQTDTPEGINQRQSIAYSNDRGRSWIKYPGNPVIPNHGIANYRDPKVFWHKASGRWVMILAAHDRVELHTSPDLKNWAHASDFGPGQGSQGFPWECPDLFELPVDGDPEHRKWVMTVCEQHETVHGGSGIQYFIGDFDGVTFHNDNPPEYVLWVDYGRDNYAGVTWSDHPDNHRQRLFIGWMSNLDYANDIPAETARGAMTLPRILTLRSFPEGLGLVTVPVPALAALRKEPALLQWEARQISDAHNLVDGNTLEILAQFRVDDATTATEFGFKLRKGSGRETLVGYDVASGSLFVDRGRSGDYVFLHEGGRHNAPLQPEDGVVRLQIYLDRTSVEVFGNGGRRVITDLIFPPADALANALYALGGSVFLETLSIHELKRIHRLEHQ